MESLKHRIKYFLRWIKMPVQNGPLKGLRWIVTSGKHFITGNYEPYKTKAFLANLKEGPQLRRTRLEVRQRVAFQKPCEKSLGQIFGIVGREPPAPSIGVKRWPIDFAELGESLAPDSCRFADALDERPPSIWKTLGHWV